MFYSLYQRICWLLLCSILLVACGDSVDPKTDTPPGTGTASSPVLNLVLNNSSGATITTIDAGNPATVVATLTQANGTPISNAIISFETDPVFGKLIPATALTDANGKARVAINAASATTAGAATVSASYKQGETEIKGSTNYAVQATTSAPVSSASTSLSLALTNNSGQAISKISNNVTATVSATLLNANGAPIPNAVINFETDSKLGIVYPSTALTDSQGKANTSLSSANLTAAGAAVLNAKTQFGEEEITGSIGYAVGSARITMSSPSIDINPLSAFGTTKVSVNVYSDGVLITSPQTVSFSSGCASNNKAAITASVLTVDGVAAATYRDNGCASTDTITATISNLATTSSTLSVNSPTIGSIQFISANPNTIALKGTGGPGRSETSQVVFKVVDTNGNPLGGRTVNFSLSTSVGGISLLPSSAISDSQTGEVLVSVNAGTISTPVRVIASVGSLSTQSDQLSISTGIPTQQNVSLTATQLNIEGLSHDGTTTVLTARLADQFNNPVFDGTVVNFMSEGGSVEPSCTTQNGACSVTWTSQQIKPRTGRATVVAYAVGEEGFTDINGDGWINAPSEMIDANNNSTDTPELFLDSNEDGQFTPSSERSIDFNGNGSYDYAYPNPSIAAPLYNGVLCDTSRTVGSNGTACNSQKSLHVYDDVVIVLSGSDAVININGGSTITLPPCTSSGPGNASTFTVTIVDTNGNAMPVGSTVEFTTSNGTFVSETSHVVPNTNRCRTGTTGCPSSAARDTFGNYSVTMTTDASFSEGVCTNERTQGVFSVKVTTPKGEISGATMTIND